MFKAICHIKSLVKGSLTHTVRIIVYFVLVAFWDSGLAVFRRRWWVMYMSNASGMKCQFLWRIGCPRFLLVVNGFNDIEREDG